MKMTFRTVAILYMGITTGISSSTFAGPVSQSVQWTLSSGYVGQFDFFKRQPKDDPFKEASQSVKRLMDGKKLQAAEHVRQGRTALNGGNLEAAIFHHQRAESLSVSFAPGEDSPAHLAADIKLAKDKTLQAANGAKPRPLPNTTAEGLPTAKNFSTDPAKAPPSNSEANVQRAGGAPESPQASRAVYNPARDPSYNRQATGNAAENLDVRFSPPTDPNDPSIAPVVSPAVSPGPANAPADPSIASGQPQIATQAPAAKATNEIKREPPIKLYSRSTLSETDRAENKHASAVRAAAPATDDSSDATATSTSTGSEDRLILETGQSQERLRQQVMAEVARQSRQALDIREEDPIGAIKTMQKVRAAIGESALSGSDKKILFGRVDRMLGELENYVERHRAEIELNEQNQQILDDLKRKRNYRVEVDQRLAGLVDEYNKLRNEQRFYEAEVKAKEARTLAPDEPVVTQMFEEIRFYRRVMNNQSLREEKEDAVWNTLNAVEFASIPYGDDRNPIQFIDHGDWEKLSERRSKFAGDAEPERHPSEIEINHKLSTPISLKFKDAPLSEVVGFMKKVADINIYLDPQGLAEEGVHPSTLVTIDLSQEISLRSALNLILGPLHLDYVIKNEVLKITSEQLRGRIVYSKTYNVADLVLPIPNAPQHSQMGLPDSLARGYQRTNQNLAGANGFEPPQVSLATHSAVPGLPEAGTISESTLAQSSGGFSNSGNSGGQSQADFDSLMELITTTIEPESWDDMGGEGAISPFETNLSLVISQTQEVHEKIADLLDQLRRLQDLQVTIEVRFINLNDDFFEQIGVDFDFNIDSNVTDANLPNNDNGRSTTIGLGFDNGGLPTDQRAQANNPISNLINGENDIQIRQGTFPLVAPRSLTGYNPAAATTLGVAILSDLEAYFFVRAVQGDKRTNILQSPKVTLFNGQAATISDQIQQPFVTSVTPVVGDFAAAQAPVIVVLAEGTTLSVQAVVSPDRRYVRLTLVPFFSEIRDVNEFTFEGSKTSTEDRTDSNEETADGGTANSATNNASSFTQGTTIQLPTFAFTTVTTTVSVPDGGTVLLGGVKRLNEQRSEMGTPLLSKIPYISRLFKNVAVGRKSESLMLMVTPRIIIQEEEEELRGFAP